MHYDKDAEPVISDALADGTQVRADTPAFKPGFEK
jgi:hypothetical protein